MSKIRGISQAVYRFWDTRIHFLHLHYTYILLLILIFSGLYYCEPGTNWNYIDALFMATTGGTDTGLNTIPMSEMSTYHMILLFLSSFLGSHIIISFYVVMVRRYYFSKRFEEELKYNQKRKDEYKRLKQLRQQQQDEENQRQSLESSSTNSRSLSILSIKSTPPTQSKKRFSFYGNSKKGSLDKRTTRTGDITVHHHPFPNNNNDSSSSHDNPHIEITQQNDDEGILKTEAHRPCDESFNLSSISSTPRLSDQPSQLEQDKPTTNQQITFREDTNILRERERRKLIKERKEDPMEPIHRTNSEYEIMSQPVYKSELTKNEKYRIGGIEYRALEFLARVVPIYYLGFIFVFGFAFRIYVAASTYAQQVLATSNPTGPVNAWFFSMFMSLSSLTNLGLNHLDASMAPFQNAPAPLILSIILILVGNTAYAILLRFIIWSCYVMTPKSKVMRRETFRYLLDHPRRCYTTLFPSTQTWWLLIVLVGITLVEVVCFLTLNYWLPVLADISWGSRVLDGIFQSVATRNAGFSVVNLADLNPGTQLVYIIAMYISVYPVAISMRNSNIYQERALGIFRGEDEEPIQFSDTDLADAPFIKLQRHSTMTSIAQGTKKLLKGPDFFVITQIQRQLTSDICWVITGIFCICALEAQNIMSPSPITIATVIYECVSAFGNVGASTGYPNTATSQAGQYRVLSKLVLIILMYRGRHRGLPASIDRSILLPSDELVEREKEDEQRRRNTSVSILHTSDASSATATGTSLHPAPLVYTRSSTL